MKNNNTFSIEELEAIERYLGHEMGAAEQTQFEQRMKDDPGFQEKVNTLRSLIESVQTASLKTTLEAFHKNMESTSPDVASKHDINKASRWLRPSLYAIAAVFLVLFGLFYFLDREPAHEQVFADHYSPDPGLPTTMSTEKDFSFFDAMVDYKRADYSSAIKKWKSLAATGMESDTLTYFLGMAYLAAGSTDISLDYLKHMNTYPESIFTEDAIFYRALALIKKGALQEAILLLEQHPSEKNNKLLQDLRDKI